MFTDTFYNYYKKNTNFLTQNQNCFSDFLQNKSYYACYSDVQKRFIENITYNNHFVYQVESDKLKYKPKKEKSTPYISSSFDPCTTTDQKIVYFCSNHKRIRINPQRFDANYRIINHFSVDIDKKPQNLTEEEFFNRIQILIDNFNPNFIVLNINKKFSIQLFWVLDKKYYTNSAYGVHIRNSDFHFLINEEPLEFLKNFFVKFFGADNHHSNLNAKNPFYKGWNTIEHNDQLVNLEELCNACYQYQIEHDQQIIKEIEKKKSTNKQQIIVDDAIKDLILIDVKKRENGSSYRNDDSRNWINFDTLRFSAYDYTNDYFHKNLISDTDFPTFYVALLEHLQTVELPCEYGNQNEFGSSCLSIAKFCFNNTVKFAQNYDIRKSKYALYNLFRKEQKRIAKAYILDFFNRKIPQRLAKNDVEIMIEDLKLSYRTIAIYVAELRKQYKDFQAKPISKNDLKIYDFVITERQKSKKITYQILAMTINKKFKRNFDKRTLQSFVDDIKQQLFENENNAKMHNALKTTINIKSTFKKH